MQYRGSTACQLLIGRVNICIHVAGEYFEYTFYIEIMVKWLISNLVYCNVCLTLCSTCNYARSL